ncbi:MAG: hypothetical protein KAT04_15770 [Methylococcales bacterium]|nr:hypothetical protein [Methylococcales bacterium]
MTLLEKNAHIHGDDELQAAEQTAGYQIFRPDQIALLDNVENCTEDMQDAIRQLALASANAGKCKAQSKTKK